jgi:putative SOS response-associated peptidase YedK
MCGRLVVTLPDLSALVAQFDVGTFAAGDFGAHFNIAPTQLAPVITNEPSRRLDLFHFGLVPFWAKSQTAQKLINARVETVAKSRAYGRALRERRCIVPVQGYYEWQSGPGGKQPLFIHDSGGEVLPLAGVWARARNDDGQRIESFAIITRPSSGALASIHSRMPLTVPRAALQLWLDPEAKDAEVLAPVLAAEPDLRAIATRRVSKLVNSPKNDGPECIEPLSAEQAARERPQLELFADDASGPGPVRR